MDYSDATPDITYSYDRQGRQTEVVQGGHTTRRWLDAAGNRLGESYAGGPLAGLRVTNQYDLLMRRTNLAVVNSQGAVLASTAYAYDEASRLSQVSSGTVAAGYSYLANSARVGQIGFANNGNWRMTTTQAYDAVNRLTEVSSAPAGANAGTYSYAYDGNGNVMALVSADDGSWLAKGIGDFSQKKTFSLAPGASFELYHGYDQITSPPDTPGAGWTESMSGECSCTAR